MNTLPELTRAKEKALAQVANLPAKIKRENHDLANSMVDIDEALGEDATDDEDNTANDDNNRDQDFSLDCYNETENLCDENDK